MGKYGKMILGLSIVGLIGAFAYNVMKQVQKLTEFCYDFGGYKINSISFKEIAMDVILRVKNKSDVSVTVTGYSLRVYVNGNFVSKIESNKQQVIPAQKKEPFSLSFAFDPKVALKNVFTMQNILAGAVDKSKVIIRIDGRFSANVGGVKASNIPVEIESSLAEMLAPSPETAPCE